MPNLNDKTFDVYVTSTFDIAYALSRALDLVNPLINNHHQRVAFIAGSLAQEAGYSEQDTENIIIASLIHDIGVVMEEEFNELTNTKSTSESEFCHAIVGAQLMSCLKLFPETPELIRYHHSPYGGEHNPIEPGKKVPEKSMVIHLADRVDVLLKRDTPSLDQKANVIENINKFDGIKFHPEHVRAFNRLAQRESFWFDIEEQEKYKLLKYNFNFSHISMNIDNILETAKLLSRIIDFRCIFTANHSAGVAIVAEVIAKLMKYSEDEGKSLKVAGYLHDIGKLGIPSAILYKQGRLDDDEIQLLKKHPYFTYSILNTFQIFDKIKDWAAFHHENLDGTGYPFHLKEHKLDTGCRIMAVSDVFTALTEERPYRESLPYDQVKEIMDDMCKSNKLDKMITELVLSNFDYVNGVRYLSQAEEMDAFKAFKNIIYDNEICTKNKRFVSTLD